MLAPVLPWLTDREDQLDQALGSIAAAGASGATAMALHLKPATKRWFMGWLARERPDLITRYEELYGGGTYVPKSYRDMLAARVRLMLRKHGLGGGSSDTERSHPPLAHRHDPSAPQTDGQLRLV
jgi:DNA repair photolyase